jgi:hypothetical protein
MNMDILHTSKLDGENMSQCKFRNVVNHLRNVEEESHEAIRRHASIAKGFRERSLSSVPKRLRKGQ